MKTEEHAVTESVIGSLHDVTSYCPGAAHDIPKEREAVYPLHRSFRITTLISTLTKARLVMAQVV